MPKKKPKKRALKNKKSGPRKITKPRKHKAFSNYAFWRSLPIALKDMQTLEIKKIGFEANDVIFKKLLEIDTKTEFSKEFNVSRNQLAVWDRSEVLAREIEELNRDSIAMKFKKDIDFAFTMKTLEEADAKRVELWYQLFQGKIIPKKLELGGSIEAKMTFADFVKEMSKEGDL